MSFYTPDLTGSDPNYAVYNDIYTVYTTSQIIEFNAPIFANSLVINIVGTTRIPFVENTDWSIVAPTNIDYNATSKILNYDSSFSATLINSITITSSTTLPYKIACSYQKLYPVVDAISVGSGAAVELTPDLIVNILQRLSIVEQDLATVPNVIATTPSTPILLPLDANETNTNNVVTEVHTVNTFNNQNLIRPTCGSFFYDSVVLVAGSTTLVKGTDYLIVGLDRVKTLSTSNTSGVYNFILLTYAYAGTVTLTCHAYGGDVTFYDMTALNNAVVNINSYLNQLQFLTPTTLGNNVVVQSLTSRISTLETTVRNLINSGTPTYGDATGTGVSTVQKLRSNDTALHWWTISSLYTVAGSSQVVLADRQHFRMQMQNAHLSADIYINVDTTLPNPFEIDAISVNQNLEYTPFTAYGIAPVTMPQFRVIWNTSSGAPSGILLQIGLKLTSMTETIALQDLSGSESCWILLPGASSAVLPSDGMVTLPNTTFIWDPTNSASVVYTHMMPNKTGYLAWGGSLPVAYMSTTSNGLTPLVDATLILSDITKIRLEFTNGDAHTVIIHDIPVQLLPGQTELTSSTVIVNTGTDTTTMVFTVVLSIASGIVTLTVAPDHIPTTTLSLRHVILLLE